LNGHRTAKRISWTFFNLDEWIENSVPSKYKYSFYDYKCCYYFVNQFCDFNITYTHWVNYVESTHSDKVRVHFYDKQHHIVIIKYIPISAISNKRIRKYKLCLFLTFVFVILFVIVRRYIHLCVIHFSKRWSFFF